MEINLASEVGKVLNTFEHSVETAVDRAAEEVAKEAVKKLKAASPTGRGTWGGHYARKWKTKVVDGKTVVYNEKYQLTHLLEKGHDIVSHGHNSGHVPAQPHIKPVEEWCQDEFEKRIAEELEKGVL